MADLIMEVIPDDTRWSLRIPTRGYSDGYSGYRAHVEPAIRQWSVRERVEVTGVSMLFTPVGLLTLSSYPSSSGLRRVILKRADHPLTLPALQSTRPVQSFRSASS